MSVKNNIAIGILAHVDAGKTTLSESLLFKCGVIRSQGRVDKGNAFLDNYELEKARGITIFSKQAIINMENMVITLLDTPGHIDFSCEMERALSVMDYAILVIDASDGVKSYTKTLWNLLEIYGIPVFIFINKMDQVDIEKKCILQNIKNELSENCCDFSTESIDSSIFYEEIAEKHEDLLVQYIETGRIDTESIKSSIYDRKIIPCYFGSALKLDGIDEFIHGISCYCKESKRSLNFGARVYKITRDNNGNRLTHLKVTGGELNVKMMLGNEKVNQIRVYSGDKYTTCNCAGKGMICAVTGLNESYAGKGYGEESDSLNKQLEPIMIYRVVFPENCDPASMVDKFIQLQEEDPTLNVVWDNTLKEMYVNIMGEIQIQILKSVLKDRFGINIDLDSGNVIYKETISNKVEGVGHFEPLRHYAEVHLLLEPGEENSGITVSVDCNEDVLAKNWQNLICKHITEKRHIGVLTGSEITDIKITVIGGKAHLKHTEGGDFRQATYRAIRQGLKMTESVLLEPYYKFKLEVPLGQIGKAINDIEKMSGKVESTENKDTVCEITGIGPVITIREYQKNISSYTKGKGRISCTFDGYKRCHNSESIINEYNYDSENDINNPTGSVFCSGGSGFYVSYDKVSEYMHIPFIIDDNKKTNEDDMLLKSKHINDEYISLDEIDSILNRTYYSNSSNETKKFRKNWKKDKGISIDSYRKYELKKKSDLKREEYLLVDGYNVIFAWEELNELAQVNMDGARGKLLDTLCNYQAIKMCNLIVVFDAYRIKGHKTEIVDYHNIHVVYTKEAETADQYIEKFAHTNSEKYNIKVATSDGLEQIIIRGEGCMLISSRELRVEIEQTAIRLMEDYENNRESGKINLLGDKVEKAINDINN